MKIKTVAGCVLAGGKNTRMGGRNKAFIEIKGETIIDRILKVFKSVFEEIILVTNTPDLFSKYTCQFIITPDIIKNTGPLGGIFTGLRKTSKEAVFFTACDMPNLHNGIIRRQVEFFEKTNHRVCVARTEGFIEPLHAVYKKELYGKIEKYIKKNTDYSLRAFLKTTDTVYFETDKIEIFQNINTPADLTGKI